MLPTDYDFEAAYVVNHWEDHLLPTDYELERAYTNPQPCLNNALISDALRRSAEVAVAKKDLAHTIIKEFKNSNKVLLRKFKRPSVLRSRIASH